MGGWQGGDKEMSQEDKKNILNAEIAELERRKNDLAKEIEEQYRAYKNRLDLDYNTRLKKIEEAEAQRQVEAKSREDNLVRRSAFLENQISSGAAEIKTKLDLAQQQIKDASDAGGNYAKLSEELKANYETKHKVLEEEISKIAQEREDLTKERFIIKEIQERLSVLEKQNQETQRRLEAALKDAEGRQAYLVYWEGEVKKQDEQSASLKDTLANQKLDQDNRELAIADNEAKTKELLAQANQLLKDTQHAQDILNKQLLEVKLQGESNAAWRDELNELQITLNEKERYYLIREREIDGKIRILQKLREGEGK